MRNVLFTTIERFGPPSGEAWSKYVGWSGLAHLEEVVSLDSSLCPNAIGDLVADDWNHNVNADWTTHLFRDPEYLMRRSEGGKVWLVGVLDEPTEEEVAAFRDPRFELCGFDLIEDATGISALVNCGGFDRAFSGLNLSPCGLLRALDEARAVQARLLGEYPEELHANCRLWALWRWVPRAAPRPSNDP